MRRKASIEELVKLYFEEGKSLSEVSKIVDLTKPNIRNRLISAGHKLRPPMYRGWTNPNYAPKRSPTVLDIAWAAGVYEGEGSVTTKQSGYGNHTRAPMVSLVQKDNWLCHQLCALFGGTVRVYNGGVRKTPHNHWRLSGPRAVGFLMTIYKFLSPRRQQQIREALAKAGRLAAQAA